ncbi:hypothetical protein N2W54_005003 [Lotmaria passim]
MLQEKELAPPGAFWVRGAGGLDDSFTNITETNMPPHPKAEKQLQQAAMQRAKKAAAAAAAAAQSSGKKRRSLTSEAAAMAASPLFLDIDRREGTLNIEEVVLSWIKVVAILTRDSTEEDRAWVRDPQGNPVRVDRYVIRRYEHDGVRFFIGVTPRFVGQQRRIEKVLGEVYALEERESRRRLALQQQGEDGLDDYDNDGLRDDDDNDDGFGGGNRHLASLSLVSHHRDPISYALGRQAVADRGFYNDVWGPPGVPPAVIGSPNTVATAPTEAARRTSLTLPAVNSYLNSVATPAAGADELAEASSRLAFAAVFGGGGSVATAAAADGAVPPGKADSNTDLAGGGYEVDDLLERYKPDPFFFGDNDDE